MPFLIHSALQRGLPWRRARSLPAPLSCSPARTKSLSLSWGGGGAGAGQAGLPPSSGADPPLWPHRFPLFPPALAGRSGYRRRPLLPPRPPGSRSARVPNSSARHSGTLARRTSPVHAARPPSPPAPGSAMRACSRAAGTPPGPSVPSSGSHVARGLGHVGPPLP